MAHRAEGKPPALPWSPPFPPLVNHGLYGAFHTDTKLNYPVGPYLNLGPPALERSPAPPQPPYPTSPVAFDENKDSGNELQQKTFSIFMTEARSLYDRKLFTDVTLQCEGEIFPVHKLVLVSNSPYFKKYFLQLESSHYPTMLIDFMSAEVLQVILNYFYTGRISITSQQQSQSLLEASSTLQIPLLSNYFLELFLKKKSSEVSLSDWQVIKKLKKTELVNIFLTIIVKKLASFNTTQNFLRLSDRQMYMLLECPAVEELDQNVILQSILNWIKYDSGRRKQLLTYLLENYVSFEKLDPLMLFKLQNESMLMKNTYFLRNHLQLMQKRVISDAKKVHQNDPFSFQNDVDSEESNYYVNYIHSIPNDQMYFTNPNVKKQFFIYEFKEEVNESNIWLYNYSNNEIELMIAHPLLNKVGTTILYRAGNIYAIGGKHYNGGCYNSLYLYNLKTKQWLPKENMLNYKKQATAVELHDHIYVFGGNDGQSPVSSVEKYDSVRNQWEAVADLPAANEVTVPVVQLNNRLFAFLNCEFYDYDPEEDEVDECYLYEYNPEADEWYRMDTELNGYSLNADVHLSTRDDQIFIIEAEKPEALYIFDLSDNSVTEDIVPTVLTQCDGILNLENPEILEFLVSGNNRWFLYRPTLHSWTYFDPKRLADFKIPMLTLLPSNN